MVYPVADYRDPNYYIVSQQAKNNLDIKLDWKDEIEREGAVIWPVENGIRMNYKVEYAVQKWVAVGINMSQTVLD